MKKKIAMLLSILLCVLITACAERDIADGMYVYYLNADGNALIQETYPTATIEGALEKLKYHSVLPKGVEVKKYNRSNHIQRPLIQKLVGACHPEGARGIFVTTSSFSKGAIAEAYRSNIRLIDGQEFVRLLKSCI